MKQSKLVKSMLIAVLIISTILSLVLCYNVIFSEIKATGQIVILEDVQCVRFNPFEFNGPMEFEVPVKYNFDEGEVVDCTIRITNLPGVRYYELINVKPVK